MLVCHPGRSQLPLVSLPRNSYHAHPAAINFDICPTFTPEESISHVEAHLLDFEKDLYGQQIRLEFVEYLRPEERYPSVEELLEQISRDIEKTREILG